MFKNSMLIALILSVGCGTTALVTTEEPVIADASTDAGTKATEPKGKESFVDTSYIGKLCIPQGGTVPTDQIDAASCIPDGGTGGNIVCYTLAQSCAFCCVEW
jgi:hypothetical protein